MFSKYVVNKLKINDKNVIGKIPLPLRTTLLSDMFQNALLNNVWSQKK